LQEMGTITANIENKLETSEDFSLEKHLEEIETVAIKKALEETRWNKTAAAKKLGMTFRSFRYRLKKLGIE
jgi:two-component system response regulator PilR (NtrC family)